MLINLVFTDLGKSNIRRRPGRTHRIYRTATGLSPEELRLLARVSATDYYLDSQAHCRSGHVRGHSDADLNVDIPEIICLPTYRSIGGIQIPFQIYRAINGVPAFRYLSPALLPMDRDYPTPIRVQGGQLLEEP